MIRRLVYRLSSLFRRKSPRRDILTTWELVPYDWCPLMYGEVTGKLVADSRRKVLQKRPYKLSSLLTSDVVILARSSRVKGIYSYVSKEDSCDPS